MFRVITKDEYELRGADDQIRNRTLFDYRYGVIVSPNVNKSMGVYIEPIAPFVLKIDPGQCMFDGILCEEDKTLTKDVSVDTLGTGYFLVKWYDPDASSSYFTTTKDYASISRYLTEDLILYPDSLAAVILATYDLTAQGVTNLKSSRTNGDSTYIQKLYPTKLRVDSLRTDLMAEISTLNAKGFGEAWTSVTTFTFTTADKAIPINKIEQLDTNKIFNSTDTTSLNAGKIPIVKNCKAIQVSPSLYVRSDATGTHCYVLLEYWRGTTKLAGHERANTLVIGSLRDILITTRIFSAANIDGGIQAGDYLMVKVRMNAGTGTVYNANLTVREI